MGRGGILGGKRGCRILMPPIGKTGLGNKPYPKVDIFNCARGHQDRLLIVQHGWSRQTKSFSQDSGDLKGDEFGRSSDDLERPSGFQNFYLSGLGSLVCQVIFRAVSSVTGSAQ